MTIKGLPFHCAYSRYRNLWSQHLKDSDLKEELRYHRWLVILKHMGQLFLADFWTYNTNLNKQKVHDGDIYHSAPLFSNGLYADAVVLWKMM